MVSKLQKETLIADGQRKEKAEEPKHSDRSVEFKRIKQSNYNENKTEIYVEREQLDIKGCVHYIFASLFLGLNESTCQMKKNVFYFTSKPLFILEKIKF